MMRILPFSVFGSRVEAGVLQVERDVLSVLDELLGSHHSVQWLNQVHGTTLVEVSHVGAPLEGDALMTRIPGLRLLIKTADCIPLVLADEELGLVAAVHAGWRGLTADIVPLTLARLVKEGARMDRLKVGIGPSLRVECAAFSKPYEELPERYHWAVREDSHVDLWAILEWQLREAGVPTEHVEWMRVCTACSPDWFSWRRSKVMERFGTYIALR